MTLNATDWNTKWKRQWNRYRDASMEQTGAAYWDNEDAARDYYRKSLEHRNARVDPVLAGLPLAPTARVLDIGAGPGSITIPLARKVAHVTAVEPSGGMYTVLRENLATESVSNVDTLQKLWEDVDVSADLDGPYDIVFARNSLNVPDIKDAIGTMIAASSDYLAIYWFAGLTPWEMMSCALWPALHGREFASPPKCDIIYNLLYSMGIYPSVESVPFPHTYVFPTSEAAVEYFAPRSLQPPRPRRTCSDSIFWPIWEVTAPHTPSPDTLIM
ncbi:class I SAM-dependent methyltransferase [Methanovulcanius yangii]|uniref:class I SAM-dependent methyltransferase n=1 Tax=Methanovulcanius yangii TaxID=1789227 RepID=UPI0029CAA1FF|nr:methyltransferase domain-containing protein [Methanovulcanius yangii]